MKTILKLTSAFLLCGLVLLGSCNGEPKHPAELVSADSLVTVITKTDSLFGTVKPEEMVKALNDINYCLAYIQTNLKDTIRREQAAKLSGFHNLKRPLAFYVKGREEMKKKITEEKVQCKNLAHDLRNNTLEEKLDVKTCIQNERNRVGKINAALTNLVPALSAALISYKAQHTGIDSIMQVLKAKGGIEPSGNFKTDSGDGDDD